MSRKQQPQFFSVPRTLRSRKSELTMIDFGVVKEDLYPVQEQPNDKRKEYKLPLIDHIKTLRKHYVSQHRYEQIEGYRRKIYDPQMCARSHRLEALRAYRKVDFTARDKTDDSPLKYSYKKLSPDRQVSIQTVPLQFLVMKSSTEKYLVHNPQ